MNLTIRMRSSELLVTNFSNSERIFLVVLPLCVYKRSYVRDFFVIVQTLPVVSFLTIPMSTMDMETC